MMYRLLEPSKKPRRILDTSFCQELVVSTCLYSECSFQESFRYIRCLLGSGDDVQLPSCMTL